MGENLKIGTGPVWYAVSQSGYSIQSDTQLHAFSPKPQGFGYNYSPDLEMTRFTLLFSGLSRPVALAQMDDYRLVNLYWTYEEVDHPGTDFVVLARTDDGVFQMAALGSGRQVAVFRYAGQEDLAEHLDLLAGILTK